MIADIGDEYVPVLAPDYDDADPIKGYVRAKDFIEQVYNKGY